MFLRLWARWLEGLQACGFFNRLANNVGLNLSAIANSGTCLLDTVATVLTDARAAARGNIIIITSQFDSSRSRLWISGQPASWPLR